MGGLLFILVIYFPLIISAVLGFVISLIIEHYLATRWWVYKLIAIAATLIASLFITWYSISAYLLNFEGFGGIVLLFPIGALAVPLYLSVQLLLANRNDPQYLFFKILLFAICMIPMANVLTIGESLLKSKLDRPKSEQTHSNALTISN